MREHDGEQLPMHFLKPGEMFVGKEPTAVRTVLGSCVALTVFDKRLNVGAICHGLMPLCCEIDKCDDECLDRFRFVDCAIASLVCMLDEQGSKRGDLSVKLFGGADMLDNPSSNSVGAENIRSALDMIARESLKLVAQDVGDSFARKLIFHPHTGEVFVKRLNNGHGLKEKDSDET